MTKSTSLKRPRKVGCLGWILRLFVLLIVVLGIIRYFAPDVIVSQANQQIPKQLKTDGRLQDVKLALLNGYAELDGLVLDQPEGFGEGSLISIGKASVDLDPIKLKDKQLKIEDVQLSDLDLNLALKPGETTGTVFNILAMLPDLPKAEKPEPPSAEPVDLDVQLVQFQGKNLHFSFSDTTREMPWLIGLSITEVTVKDIVYSALSKPQNNALPGTISLRAELAQPVGVKAKLLLDVHLMPILGTNIPPVVGSVRIVGLDLDIFAPFLVPGAKSAFGGSAFDLELDFRVGPSVLDVNGAIITDKGTSYPIKASGSPLHPTFYASGLFGAVFKRPGAFVGDVVGNVADAATQTATAAVDTAGTAIKGGVKTVGKVVGGLGKTLKGVATLDLKEVEDGLTEGTLGAAKEAGNTVLDTGSTALKGVQNVGGAALGSGKLAAWFEAAPQRFEKAEEANAKFLESAEIPARTAE